MSVCLKCGEEFVYGPEGCACTRRNRYKKEMEAAREVGKAVAAKLEKDPKWRKSVAALRKQLVDAPWKATRKRANGVVRRAK